MHIDQFLISLFAAARQSGQLPNLVAMSQATHDLLSPDAKLVRLFGVAVEIQDHITDFSFSYRPDIEWRSGTDYATLEA